MAAAAHTTTSTEKSSAALTDVAACCGRLRRLCAEPLAPFAELTIEKELRGLLSARPITVDILKQTGIAKVVKPLRKHQSGVVAELAVALFTQWKVLAKTELQNMGHAQQAGAAVAAANTAGVSSRVLVSEQTRSLSGDRYDKRLRRTQLVRAQSRDEQKRTRAAQAEEARHLLQARQTEAEVQVVRHEAAALASSMERTVPGPGPASEAATLAQLGAVPKELSGEPPGTVLSEAPFRFWSNATEGAEHSDCRLSNLRAATVELHGLIYPSAEHAYQALKFPAKLRKRFAVGGDLASFSAFRWFFPAREVDKKIAYWRRKEMVGVVAKMVSNEKHAKAAGLPPPSFELGCTPESFFEINLSKYTRSFELRQVLLGTGARYLLEFVRSAERQELNGGGRCRWGGLVKDPAQSGAAGWLLIGENRMGRCLMWVREELRRRRACAQPSPDKPVMRSNA